VTDKMKRRTRKDNDLDPNQRRVLQVLLHEVRGGAEEHVLSVLGGMRDNGFTPLIAAPAGLLNILEPDLRKLQITSFPLEVPTAITWAYRTAQLAKILTAHKIDLIHSHSATASFCAGPAALLSTRQPIIETCHGREFWRISKLIKGSFWIDRQASRCIDKFIAVSNATARYLSKEKGISSSKIVVIHNGRDLKSLRPPSAKERMDARAELELTDEYAVLLLGRLSIEKGHALLLEALRLLEGRRPPIIALFAGLGPLESELRSRCHALGLDRRVRFLGYRSDLQRILAGSDLVVLPSLSEGLPLAAVEALAAARPIVAADVGGISEVVLDGETGSLIQPQDFHALAAAIQRFVDSPGLAAKLANNGRRFVEGHFNIRTQVQRTMEVYADVI